MSARTGRSFFGVTNVNVQWAFEKFMTPRCCGILDNDISTWYHFHMFIVLLLVWTWYAMPTRHIASRRLGTLAYPSNLTSTSVGSSLVCVLDPQDLTKKLYDIIDPMRGVNLMSSICVSLGQRNWRSQSEVTSSSSCLYIACIGPSNLWLGTT